MTGIINIESCFKPCNILRTKFRNPKGIVNLMNKNGEYIIGERGHSLYTRIKDHRADVEHTKSEREPMKILQENQSHNQHRKYRSFMLENHLIDRKIREAIEIENHCRNFNTNDVWKLS